MSTFSFVIALIAAQGLLLATLLLFSRTGRRDMAIALAVALIALATFMLDDALEGSTIAANYPRIGFVLSWQIALFGPAIYFFVRSATAARPLPRIQVLLHGLPAAFLVTILLCNFFKDPEIVRQVLAEHHRSRAQGGAPVQVLLWLQLAAYLFASARQVMIRQRTAIALHADLESLRLRWLAALLVGFAVTLLEDILLGLLWPRWLAVVNLSIAFALYVLGYVALRHPELLAPLPLAEALVPGVRQGSSETRYRKSGLSEAHLQQHVATLINHFEVERPYLSSDLTLGELAGQLGISQHNLSEVLNRGLNTSFHDYVNRYRALEAQRCLSDPLHDGQTILDIAFSAGFNSKPAFNIVFKRHVGSTPSAWRKAAQAEREAPRT